MRFYYQFRMPMRQSRHSMDASPVSISPVFISPWPFLSVSRAVSEADMKATRNVAKVQLALEATTRDFLREAHDKVLRTFGDLLYDFCWGGASFLLLSTSNLQPPTSNWSGPERYRGAVRLQDEDDDRGGDFITLSL